MKNMIMDRLAREVDSYVDPTLRRNPEVFYKARAFSTCILLYSVLVIIAAIYALALDGSLASIVLINGGLLVSYSMILRQLKQSSAIDILTNRAVLATCTGIVVGLALSGGTMNSPFMPLSIVPITLAFCFCGRRPGLIWTNIVLVMLVALVIIDRFVLALPNTLTPDKLLHYQALSWVTTYLSIMVILMAYDSVNNQLAEENKLQQSRLSHVAYNDELTALANRTTLENQLSHAMARADRFNKPTALFLVNLDNLPAVHMKIGDALSDLVLQIIAWRLVRTVRRTDLVSRYDGNVFAIVLEGITDAQDIVFVADKLLREINHPINELSDSVILTASIGVSIYPNHTVDRDEMLSFAQLALKESRRETNSWSVHVPKQDASGESDIIKSKNTDNLLQFELSNVIKNKLRDL